MLNLQVLQINIQKGLSLVVVGLVVEDGEGTVELLYEEEAYHLVVESHLREGYFVVGDGIDRRGESEGTANYEDEVACASIHLFLYVLRKAYRGVFFAVLVEEHNAVGPFQPLQQQRTLAFFYLVGRGLPLVFEGGDDLQLEVHIMFEPLNVDIDALLDIGYVSFGDDEEANVHEAWDI